MPFVKAMTLQIMATQKEGVEGRHSIEIYSINKNIVRQQKKPQSGNSLSSPSGGREKFEAVFDGSFDEFNP